MRLKYTELVNSILLVLLILGRALLILSDYTVWIHLLSKAGEAALPIPWCCCSLAMGWLD
jgi:hypothetical protein